MRVFHSFSMKHKMTRPMSTIAAVIENIRTTIGGKASKLPNRRMIIMLIVVHNSKLALITQEQVRLYSIRMSIPKKKGRKLFHRKCH